LDRNQDNQSSKNGQGKMHQLEQYTREHTQKPMTTNMGVKVSNTDDSLKAGIRGPSLLEDFHMREKITHFDHERIPERVVHARGFGAHGSFQVYEPMGEYTKAKFLQDPKAKTPVFVRFSTVAGFRGSADTVRDVRGFATKFYTEEGNFDIVANNMPVFFIQDAIKFPDIIHAVKPEPHNEIPQATSAHDTFWDFVSSAPETAHLVMWVMSDRGIPRSFRMMEGFGVNTFRFINKAGKARFIKFHWKPLLGVHSLVRDEAQILCGKDPDFHRRDVWDAIEQGHYPEFELGVQILEEEQEFGFDFDILDPTKLWPEELVPVKIIGKMTLDRNVDNFFAETEQVAFCPANIVPGIDFSNDPLLQGRLFSYHDTQISRLGGFNFHELPINRPLAEIHNNQRDGMHRMTIDRGTVTYFPNALNQNHPQPVPEEEGGFVHYAQRVEGHVIRGRSESFLDHFSQASLFWNSMTPTEKEHIIDAFHFEVGGAKDPKIRKRVVDMFNNVDGELARRIAQGVGVQPPTQEGAAGAKMVSPALSQENTIQTPMGRKVAILADHGFCYDEVAPMMDSLMAAGVACDIVAMNLGLITSADGRELEATKDFVTTHSVMYDAVYVPGGEKSIASLSDKVEAIHFIDGMYKHFKAIGAVNEGVDLLRRSQSKDARLATPDSAGVVCMDNGVVSVRQQKNIDMVVQEFIQAVGCRHWGRKQ
jgi:catalase